MFNVCKSKIISIDNYLLGRLLFDLESPVLIQTLMVTAPGYSKTVLFKAH